MAPLSFVYKFNVLLSVCPANETPTVSKEKSKLAGIAQEGEQRFIENHMSSMVSRGLPGSRNPSSIQHPERATFVRKYYLPIL
jgi:hypothetical protein